MTPYLIWPFHERHLEVGPAPNVFGSRAGKGLTAEFPGGMHGGARSANAQTSAVLRENLRVPPRLILGLFLPNTDQRMLKERPTQPFCNHDSLTNIRYSPEPRSWRGFRLSFRLARILEQD